MAYGKGEAIGDSSLDWGRIELIPTDSLVSDVVDSKLRGKLTDDIVNKLLPSTAGNDHYGAARETDSALVHLERDSSFPNPTAWTNAPSSYFEKFLFYRGVGKFQLPYTATFDGEKSLMTNHGDLAMNSAILIDADAGKIRAAKIGGIAAGHSVAFPETESVTEEELAKLVQESLIAEGLYEKEASAMVNVWRKSWFTENGTRILYMVPQTLTDELIPLHIKPAPSEALRVLVGRMEVMSPSDEQQMITMVQESARQRKAFYAVKDRDPKKRYAIPEAIRKFGRMAEPALIRVSQIIGDKSTRIEAETLIRQYQAAKPTTEALASWAQGVR